MESLKYTQSHAQAASHLPCTLQIGTCLPETHMNIMLLCSYLPTVAGV